MESILKFAVNLMIQNESNLLALSFDKLLEFLKDKLFNVYIAEAFIKDDKGKEIFVAAICYQHTRYILQTR